jgi:uncharacterized membrane protein
MKPKNALLSIIPFGTKYYPLVGHSSQLSKYRLQYTLIGAGVNLAFTCSWPYTLKPAKCSALQKKKNNNNKKKTSCSSAIIYYIT